MALVFVYWSVMVIGRCLEENLDGYEIDIAAVLCAGSELLWK